MEKKVFVYVNSDSISVCSQLLNKTVLFADKGIRNPQPIVIALVIRECLDENSLYDKDVVLIPGTEYITCSEKITSHVKKTALQETQPNDFNKRVLKHCGSELILLSMTKYIFEGKTIKHFEAIPLLQKYFANRKAVIFNMSFVNQLTDSLLKNDIIITGITTIDAFLNRDSQKKHFYVNIGKNSSTISISEAGITVNTVLYEEGMDKIINDVSNNFNVSASTSSKLVNKFGFVFLPPEYHNVVIDIPVYGKLMQSIPMPDLTYCIRESLKEIYNGIITSLSAKVRDYYYDSEFSCETYNSINGMENLFELLLNNKVKFINSNQFIYHSFISTYNNLIKVDIENTKIIAEIQKPKPEFLEQVHTPLFDRITGIFNSKIKPLLLEPDFQ